MKGIFSAAVYSTDDAISASFSLASVGFVFLISVGHTLFESGVMRKKNS